MLTFKTDFSFFQGEAFTLRWRRREKGTSSRHVKSVVNPSVLAVKLPKSPSNVVINHKILSSQPFQRCCVNVARSANATVYFV